MAKQTAQLDLTRPESLPPFLSPAHIQSILGCARSLVYELIASGEIPSIRLGSTVTKTRAAIRVQTSDFLAWIRRNKTGTPAA